MGPEQDGNGDQAAWDDFDLDIDTRVFEEQARRPLAEDDCAERACKALAALGFEGLRDEAAEGADAPSDAQAAWKRQLEQEGKRSAGATRLLDLVRPRRLA